MNDLWPLITLAEYPFGKTATYYLWTSNGWRDLGMLLVGIICVASFWMMIVFWQKLIQGIPQSEPDQDKLFQELCTVHHLTRQERYYLKTVVQTLKLPEPGYLFVNPRYLEMYANQGDIEAKNLQLKLFT